MLDDGRHAFVGERARDVDAPAVDLTHAGAEIVEVGAGDGQPIAEMHGGPQRAGVAPMAAASLGREIS